MMLLKILLLRHPAISSSSVKEILLGLSFCHYSLRHHISLWVSQISLSLSLSPRSLQALEYCYDPRNLGPNSSKLLPHKPCTSTTYIHTLSSVLLLSGFNDPSTVGDQTVKKERKGKKGKKPTNPTHPPHRNTRLQKKTPKNAKKRCKQETKRDEKNAD
jgi:hypothetical protein